MPKSPLMRRASITGLVAAVSGSMLATNALAADLTPVRAVEIIKVTGNKLPALNSQAFSEYSVMAVTGGALVPIPFQFDDMNVSGFPYAPGGKLKIKGIEDKLDDTDELVFMYKDSGPQASTEMRSAVQGKVVAELKLTDGSDIRYAYVIQGNSQRSDKKYTAFDQKTGWMKTDNWSLKIDPSSPLTWEDFKFKGFAEDRSILDTMKVRVKAKIGFIGATIGNNLIPNKIVAVKQGPVRTVVEADASISILGIKLLTAGADFVVTPAALEVPVLASIPSAAAALSTFNIAISLDFHEMEGMKVKMAQGGSEIEVAGDKEINKKAIKLDLKNNWIAATHPKGFDILATLFITDNVKPKVEGLFTDAAAGADIDTPERYEGHHPQAGYVLSEIPTGVDVGLGVNLYFIKGIWQGDDTSLAVKQIIKDRVEVEANPL